MKPGSLNRLKDTKKACKKFFFFALLSSCLAWIWIWGRYSHGQQRNTLFSFLVPLHCHTALKSLHLCRPEGLVCLTTALLSLQQHSGAAVSRRQYEALCQSWSPCCSAITREALQSRTRELEASSKGMVQRIYHRRCSLRRP